jgi:hypothetical protein
MSIARRRFKFRRKMVFVEVNDSEILLRPKSVTERAVFSFHDLFAETKWAGASEQFELPIFGETYFDGDGI